MFNFLNRKKKIEKKESATAKTLLFGTGSAVFTPREYQNLSDEAYKRNVIAYKSIKLIGMNAASIPLQVFQGDRELDVHPLIDLLNAPNEGQAKCSFLESVISFLLISGNSYIEMAYPDQGVEFNNQEPTYLYSLRPDRMKLIMGENGRIAAYEYTADTSIRFPVTRFRDSNIIHLKLFHPLNDFYGMSPIEAAAYSIDQYNETGKWNLALLQNGARPSGALQMSNKEGQSQNLDDEQFNRLKTQMEEQYSSSINAGRPMLLEGGLEWKEMSLSPKDMDFIESKHTNARDIALAFGVPPQLLGIPGDTTYNNVSEARLALWEQTIIPTINIVLDTLNMRLAPIYGKDISIKFDENEIEALTLRRAKKAEALQVLDFLTINEKRNMLGFGDLDGGDQLVVNATDEEPGTKSDYIKSLVKDGLSAKEAEHLAGIVYADKLN